MQLQYTILPVWSEEYSFPAEDEDNIESMQDDQGNNNIIVIIVLSTGMITKKNTISRGRW